MQLLFKAKKLEKIYLTGESKVFNQNIVIKFIRKINILKNISNISDLRNLRSLNFEKLKNYPKGEYSIRVNKLYRITFDIIGDEIKILEIIELSNHYQ